PVTNVISEKDLKFGLDNLEKYFPDWNKLVDRVQIEKNFQTLVTSRTIFNRFQKALLFEEVIALTNLDFSYVHFNELHDSVEVYPIQFKWFGDDLYILESPGIDQSMTGAKVKMINDKDLKVVLSSFSKIIGGNEMKQKRYIQNFLSVKDVYEYFNLLGKKGNLDILVVKGGKEKEISLPPNQIDDFSAWRTRYYENSRSRDPYYVNRPLDFSFQDNIGFFSYNKGKRLLREHNIREHILSFLKEADKNKSEKVIIDLRYNPGSNIASSLAIVDALIESSYNQYGKLYVLIGPGTGAATTVLASVLRGTTQSIFVGEATGTGPNFYSDQYLLELPDSKLQILIPTRLWRSSIERDDRKLFEPDYKIFQSYSDFQKEIDSQVEFVRTHQASPRSKEAALLFESESGFYQIDESSYVRLNKVAGNWQVDFFGLGFTSWLRGKSWLYQNGERLTTHNDNVYLERTQNGELKIFWEGIEQPLKKIRERDLPDGYMAEGASNEVIDNLISELEERYPNRNKLEVITDCLRSNKKGRYDQFLSGRTLAYTLGFDLLEVAQDIHLSQVFYFYKKVPTRLPHPDRRDPNLYLKNVEILEGNIGYIDVSWINTPNKFEIQNALKELNDTKALIIDLRQGNGGDVSGVTYLIGRFFKNKRRLIMTYYSPIHPPIEQWTTVDNDPRYLDKPVYVLINHTTGSGLESTAYHLKHMGRATIVGEQSKGACYNGSIRSLEHGISAFIPHGNPVSPITNTNFEGIGVIPDISSQSRDALDSAINRILNITQ
ncbi:MAG: S41 family peptidase, partial [Ignavibacteria bacterium]|nr:S41 family peptidase [Ignavibacteria bacterium]